MGFTLLRHLTLEFVMERSSLMLLLLFWHLYPSNETIGINRNHLHPAKINVAGQALLQSTSMCRSVIAGVTGNPQGAAPQLGQGMGFDGKTPK